MYKAILITGPGCSGATLNYNIVRFIVEYNNIDYIISHATKHNTNIIKNKKNKKLILLKKHNIQSVPINQDTSIFAFINKRDIRSIMSCSKRRWPKIFKNKSFLKIAHGEIKEHDVAVKVCQQYQVPFFIFQYESYVKDPVQYIQTTAQQIRLSVDSQWVINQIDKITKKDSNALFEYNRIGKKKIDDFSYLTTEEIKQLEINFPEWIFNDK